MAALSLMGFLGFMGLGAMVGPSGTAAAAAAAAAPVTPAAPAAPAAPAGSITLVGSVPSVDARVGVAPRTVEVIFGEPVTDAVLHVLGPRGLRVDLDGTTVIGADGTSVRVTIQSGGSGGYLAAWSAAPAAAPAPPAAAPAPEGRRGGTSGAFAFAVGRVPSWTGGPDAGILTAEGASSALAATVDAVGALGLVAAIALVGLILAVGLGWVEGADSRVVALVAAMVVVATAAGLALHGPLAAGLPAGDALTRAMARATVESAWGVASLFALAGVAIIGAARAGGAGGGSSLRTRMAAVGGLLLVASVVTEGHAVAEQLPVVWTAVLACHVACVVILCALLVVRVRSSPTARPGVTQSVAGRDGLWLAAVAVGVTGLVLALHETGTIGAATGTVYGRIVVVKALITVAILLARAATAGREPAPPQAPTRRLVQLASVLSVLAIVATGILIFQTPAHLDVARPATGSVVIGAVDVEYQLTPARVGHNAIHVYVFSRGGGLVGESQATASLAWGGAPADALPIDLSQAGPGHFLNYGLEIPLSGRWGLDIELDTPGQSTPVTFAAVVAVHP